MSLSHSHAAILAGLSIVAIGTPGAMAGPVGLSLGTPGALDPTFGTPHGAEAPGTLGTISTSDSPAFETRFDDALRALGERRREESGATDPGTVSGILPLPAAPGVKSPGPVSE